MPCIVPTVKPWIPIPTSRKAICKMGWCLKNEIGDWGGCPCDSVGFNDFPGSGVRVNRDFQTVRDGGHDKLGVVVSS